MENDPVQDPRPVENETAVQTAKPGLPEQPGSEQPGPERPGSDRGSDDLPEYRLAEGDIEYGA